MEQARFEEWAIVEIMGHQKYVGYVTEQVIAGAAFVRVDVPEVDIQPATRYADVQPAIPAFTKYFGPSSVYAITPVSEDFARAAVNRTRAKPHSIFMPELYPPDPPKALPPGDDEGTDEDGDYYDH